MIDEDKIRYILLSIIIILELIVIGFLVFDNDTKKCISNNEVVPVLEKKEETNEEELEKMGLGTVRLAAREGDVSRGTVLAGQVAGMINKEQTAREMIVEMFEQAEEVLNGASKWVK